MAVQRARPTLNFLSSPIPYKRGCQGASRLIFVFIFDYIHEPLVATFNTCSGTPVLTQKGSPIVALSAAEPPPPPAEPPSRRRP